MLRVLLKGKAMRLNGWQRLWVVVSVAITATIVWEQFSEHDLAEKARDRFNLDTVTALRNPACSEYANAAWQKSWKERSLSDPCQVILIARDFIPDHAPLTEASLAARSERNSDEWFWLFVRRGLMIGAVLSVGLYAFGWIAAKTYKWLAGMLKPQG